MDGGNAVHDQHQAGGRLAAHHHGSGRNAADIFIVPEVVNPAGGHAPHGPDAVVEDGGTMGSGTGGRSSSAKAGALILRGLDWRMMMLPRLPHGPLDILGVAEVVL